MLKWLCVILTIIFVVAKILGYLTWSWWLVFSPVIAFIVFYIIAVVLFIILDLKK